MHSDTGAPPLRNKKQTMCQDCVGAGACHVDHEAPEVKLEGKAASLFSARHSERAAANSM